MELIQKFAAYTDERVYTRGPIEMVIRDFFHKDYFTNFL